MFAATATSYAGIYRSQPEDNKRYSGGIYSNPSPSANSSEKDSSFGIFRSSPTNPGDRPGSGGGIGQEDKGDAPLGDGIVLLTAGCVLLIIVKVVVMKIKRKSIS